MLIARALVAEPEILFLDEPTASIDAESRGTLTGLLEELNQRIPVVVVTHDVTGLAPLVRRIACVNRRLVCHEGAELDARTLEEAYGCPVELVTHGVPPPRPPPPSLRSMPVPGFFDALSYEFLRNALLAGLLAAVLCGIVGPFVVVKRLAFLSDGISHAAFGGMGVCFFLGLDPLLGAVAVALLCALGLGLVDTETVRSYDALIGVLWAVGLAVGIVFVYKTPGYAPNLMTYLFGNILLVSRHDIGVLLALAVSVFLILALFWKGIVAVAFDEVFARVQGAPVRLLMVAAAHHDRAVGGDPDPGGGDHPGGGAADHPAGDRPDAAQGPAGRPRPLDGDRGGDHAGRARPLLRLRPPLGPGDHPARRRPALRRLRRPQAPRRRPSRRCLPYGGDRQKGGGDVGGRRPPRGGDRGGRRRWWPTRFRPSSRPTPWERLRERSSADGVTGKAKAFHALRLSRHAACWSFLDTPGPSPPGPRHRNRRYLHEPDSQNEIEPLLRNTGGPCVSIFLPTVRVGDTQQNPIRLKNLLRDGGRSGWRRTGVCATRSRGSCWSPRGT